MNYLNNFAKDLQIGKIAETEFIQTLSTCYPKYSNFQYNDSTSLEQLRKYDVSFTGTKRDYTVEVKFDVKSSQTGNFAFEIYYKGSPSGIQSTQADFFAVKSGNQFFVFNTKKLRSRLLNQPHKWRITDIINGTATVILVPMDEIKELAEVLQIA